MAQDKLTPQTEAAILRLVADAPDGMLAYRLAIAKPHPNDPNWPLPSFDARDWAEAFCKLNPGFDEGLALSWFANALMRGYDEHARREGDAKSCGCFCDTLSPVRSSEGLDSAATPPVNFASIHTEGWPPAAGKSPTDASHIYRETSALPGTEAATPPAPVVSVADAVAAEREACAKVAESYGSLNGRDKANEIADDIRARGQGGTP